MAKKVNITPAEVLKNIKQQKQRSYVSKEKANLFFFFSVKQMLSFPTKFTQRKQPFCFEN